MQIKKKLVYLTTDKNNKNNLNLEIMTTREQQMEDINKAVRNLASGINRWPQQGEELTARVNGTIEYLVTDLFKCENKAAENMLRSEILRLFKMNYRFSYELAFPPVGMDANGNYTYDRSKWA